MITNVGLVLIPLTAKYVFQDPKELNLQPVNALLNTMMMGLHQIVSHVLKVAENVLMIHLVQYVKTVISLTLLLIYVKVVNPRVYYVRTILLTVLVV